MCGSIIGMLIGTMALLLGEYVRYLYVLSGLPGLIKIEKIFVKDLSCCAFHRAGCAGDGAFASGLLVTYW